MIKALVVTLSILTISLLSLALACGDSGEENPFNVRSELVTIASNPIAMAFAPDGRLFYNEQYSGNVRIVTPDGELQEEPFLQVEIFPQWEWGLIGLALDPEFEANHYVYVFFMEPVTQTEETSIAKPVVMRFTDLDGRGSTPELW